VLFLDIGLPDIDGLKVLERIFKLDPQAYVVMFSGNGSKEHIMRAVELGARGFVGKPFTKEKLFQYIEKSPFVQARHVKEISHGHTIA
jgi:two-component system chemotaxis response regulator CheY